MLLMKTGNSIIQARLRMALIRTISQQFIAGSCKNIKFKTREREREREKDKRSHVDIFQWSPWPLHCASRRRGLSALNPTRGHEQKAEWREETEKIMESLQIEDNRYIIKVSNQQMFKYRQPVCARDAHAPLPESGCADCACPLR